MLLNEMINIVVLRWETEGNGKPAYGIGIKMHACPG